MRVLLAVIIALTLMGCVPAESLRLDDPASRAAANARLEDRGAELVFVDGSRLAVRDVSLVPGQVLYTVAAIPPVPDSRVSTDLAAIRSGGFRRPFLRRRGLILGATAGFGLAMLGNGTAEPGSFEYILGVVGAAGVGGVIGGFVLAPGTTRGMYVIER